MMGRPKQAFLCLLALALFSASLSAQVPTGKIFGTVTDEQGNPLPGVSVVATSPQLVGKAAALTDANGVYRLFGLTPGTYKVTFTLQGFKPVIRTGIIVAIEQTVKLDAAMPMGAIEEQVTVVGRTPLIDVKTTVKGVTLTRETIQLLPHGRDFDTLLGAVPGVYNERLLAGISVDGASGLENMFYVDGTDIGNILTGARGENVAFEFVDEVQIKASGYQAEFGGSLGGVINVISRQGGNSFHGDVLGFYSGSRLTGKERDTLRLNLYDYAIAEYVNYQDLLGKEKIDRAEAGFTLGGYFIKDRLWFFGSFLPVYLETGRHVIFDPSLKEGNYTQRYQYWNFQAKLTSQPFKFLRLGASFVNNFSKYKGALPLRDGTSNPDDFWPDYGYSYPKWSASAYADITLGNNLLIGLRGGSYYSNINHQLVQPSGIRWSLGGNGTAAFPEIPAELQRPRNWYNIRTSYVTDRYIDQRYHADADITYYLNLAGEHAWKFGVSWNRLREDRYTALKYPSVYFYWDRPYYLYYDPKHPGPFRGKYGIYGVTGSEVTGPTGYVYDIHSDRWALYLQDSWTIAGRFTINAGLRAEQEYVPAYTDDPKYKNVRPINFHFKDKLAPRVGFVYDVLGDSSLKVFGSYGLYYDVFKLYVAGASFGAAKGKSAYYTLDTYEWNKIGVSGYYPGTLLEILDNYPVTLDNIDPSLKPLSQREFSFGVEKKIIENFSATLRLVQKNLHNALEDSFLLLPDGSYFYGYFNPGRGYSLPTTQGGKVDPSYPIYPKTKREYWAVNFSLDKRFARNWLAGFSYTWSRLTGNYSGLAASDEVINWSTGEGRGSPNFEQSFDWWNFLFTKDLKPQDGPLPSDRPHYLKLYGAYTFSFGLTVGTVVNAMSGTPFTEYWWQGTVWTPFNRGYYREGTSGNTLRQMRTPFLWFADFYAEYSLRLGKTSLNFNVNVDNVFNTNTTTLYYPYRDFGGFWLSDPEALANQWDLGDRPDFIPNAMFMKTATRFPPIAARLGVRFSF
jgi:hypothetical protein